MARHWNEIQSEIKGIQNELESLKQITDDPQIKINYSLKLIAKFEELKKTPEVQMLSVKDRMKQIKTLTKKQQELNEFIEIWEKDLKEMKKDQ